MRPLRLSVSSFSALAVFLSAALFSVSAFAVTPDRISGLISSSATVVLAKSLHPKAQPQYDQGAVDPSLQFGRVTMFFAPSASQQKALDRFLAQQQDRNSPNYHKWLTAEQFGDRYGLSQNDMNKITAWLTVQGFQIISAGSSRNSVIFSGTAAQVQSAFSAEIHRYSIDGENHVSNATPLMLPSVLTGIVRSVMGLHDFRPRPAVGKRPFSGMHRPHPDYYDSEFGNFLAPGDIATIYDLTPLYTASTPIDGTGQKLVVLGQTDIALADLNDFRTSFGLTAIPTSGTGSCATNSTTGIVVSPCNTSVFQYILLGTDPGNLSADDITEADLDIEWSGAVARNAQIIYINSETTNGVFDGLTTAIPSSGTPLANVISVSYGACEAAAGDLESLFQQGTSEGVTILNSSGDTGSAACDGGPPNNAVNPPFSPAVFGLAVNYPASSTFVTGVGGTAISLDDDNSTVLWSTSADSNGGTARSYIPETPWNDDEVFATFCNANPTNAFCKQGNTTAVPGWVPITATSTASTVQEDIWISSGGGGASNCFTKTNAGVCEAGFPQPTWQQGLHVTGAPAGVRYVPDVSLLASPNFPGYILCTPQNPNVTNASSCASGITAAIETYETIVGGTSASTPVMAGMITLLNQYLSLQGLATGGLGNINPTLYKLAADQSDGAFHRITSGDNNVYCTKGTPTNQTMEPSIQCPSAGVMGYSATNSDSATGYNLVAGLGSVDADNLFIAWAQSLTSFTLAATTGTSTVSAGQSISNVAITLTPVNGFNSAVTYTCSSGVTCTFSPANPTTSTAVTATIQTEPNIATGALTVTITGTAGVVTASTTVALTITATTEAFTIATTNSSVSVAAGVAASVPITVTSTSTPSFLATSGGNQVTTLPLTYTCTGLPSESTCNFSPSSVSSSTSVTLSVATTAATARLQRPNDRGSRIFYAALLPGLFGIVFLAGSRKNSARGMRLLGLIVVLGCSTLWLGACGNNATSANSSNPGTPAGSYAITVTATTGGAAPLTNTFPFTLVVSQ
jgi:subtilase family serine protease